MDTHPAPAGTKVEPQAIPNSVVLAPRRLTIDLPRLSALPPEDEKDTNRVAETADQRPMPPRSPLPRAAKSESAPQEPDVKEGHYEIDKVIATHPDVCSLGSTYFPLHLTFNSDPWSECVGRMSILSMTNGLRSRKSASESPRASYRIIERPIEL